MILRLPNYYKVVGYIEIPNNNMDQSDYIKGLITQQILDSYWVSLDVKRFKLLEKLKKFVDWYASYVERHSWLGK